MPIFFFLPVNMTFISRVMYKTRVTTQQRSCVTSIRLSDSTLFRTSGRLSDSIYRRLLDFSSKRTKRENETKKYNVLSILFTRHAHHIQNSSVNFLD